MAACRHVTCLVLLLTSCLHRSSLGLLHTTTTGLSLSGHDHQPPVTTTTTSLCALNCHFAAAAGCTAAQYDELTGRCELKRDIHLPFTAPAPSTTHFMYYTPEGFQLAGHGVTVPSDHNLTSLTGYDSLSRGAEVSCLEDRDCVGLQYMEMDSGEHTFIPKYFVDQQFEGNTSPTVLHVSVFMIPEMFDFARSPQRECLAVGGSLSETTGAGHRACVLSCHREPACVAYTWYKDIDRCSLNDNCFGLTYIDNAFTGEK